MSVGAGVALLTVSTTALVLRLQRLEPCAGVAVELVGRATYPPTVALDGPRSPELVGSNRFGKKRKPKTQLKRCRKTPR